MAQSVYRLDLRDINNPTIDLETAWSRDQGWHTCAFIRITDLWVLWRAD